MSTCSSSGMSSSCAVDADVDVDVDNVAVDLDGDVDVGFDADLDVDVDVYGFPLRVPVVRLIIIISPSSQPCSATSVASCNHFMQVDEPHK